MGARVLAVAAAHARILARRRAVLLLLALLPLAFYGALYRHSPHAITTAGVLSAFSAGGAGIFSMLPARAADQRLALAGYQPAALILGRLLVLELAALGISALTSAVMIAGTRPAHPGEVRAGVIPTGAVAVPLGLALGALPPRELEAVLVLTGIVGIQVTTQPGHRHLQTAALPRRGAAPRRRHQHAGHPLAPARSQRRLRSRVAGHHLGRVAAPGHGPPRHQPSIPGLRGIVRKGGAERIPVVEPLARRSDLRAPG